MSTTWHADDALLERYAAGTIDHAAAYSVESHLVACAQCRSAVASTVAAPRLAMIWDEVLEAVDAPRRSPAERVLTRLGMRDSTARLLAATPSLQLSWVLAQIAAIAFAVTASQANDRMGTVLFLAVAPLIPVVGVAAAFGPAVDPAHEVAAAAPMASFRLLLIRASAVLAVSVTIAGAAAAGLPHVGWTAAAWILPALALTTATLAVGSLLQVERAAVVVGVAWVGALGASADLTGDRLAAFAAPGQLLWAAVLLVSAVAVLRRRDAFEKGFA
jgi:hypothetical protein